MPAPVPDLEIQAAARLLADGRPDEAAGALERLVGAAPAYAAGQVLLARALEAAGRPAAALDAWHRAHFLVPTSPLIRRERQRLLEQAPPEPPPPADHAADADPPVPEYTAASAWAVAPAAPGAEAELEPSPESADAPIDAVWDDGPAPPGPAPPPLPASDPIEDAGSAVTPTPDHPDIEPPMEAFDLSRRGFDPLTSPPPPPPPPTPAGESRVFAEDAFEADVAFGAEAVFTSVPDLSMDSPPASRPGPHTRSRDDEEGWTLLGETEHARADPAEPMETHVAPPTGWELVPSSAKEPPAASARPSTLEWDLDALIREIEEAPRIRPDPHFRPPSQDDPAPGQGDDEEVVSETLARIYESQGQLDEAAAVYDRLAEQRPDRADEFRHRAGELRGRVQG